MFAEERIIRNVMPNHRRRHHRSRRSWLRRLFSPRSRHSGHSHSQYQRRSIFYTSGKGPLQFKIFSITGESEHLPMFREKEPSSRKHHHHSRRHHRSSRPATFPITAQKPQEAPARENWIKRVVKAVSRPLPRTVISMSAFLVAYILVWFAYQMAVIFVASFCDLHCVLTYCEVMWTVPNSSPLWNDLNIIAITAAGPLISLVIGFLSLLILLSRPKMNPQVKLLFIWLCIIGMAHFFGAFIAGALTWQGFGFVIAWMYMPFVFRLVTAFIFLAIMAYFGWLLVPKVHSLATSQLGKQELRVFLLTRLSLPWLIGTGILLLLKFPIVIPQHENIYVYDVIILGSIAFAVLPVLFIRNGEKPLHFAPRHSHQRRTRTLLLAAWLAAAFLVLVLYRYGLREGFYVYMKVIFSISPYQ
jgi:hypothetical protein